ncbi:MAG: hypothetical protein SGPRY_003787, partial [Prymnesium sp.]
MLRLLSLALLAQGAASVCTPTKPSGRATNRRALLASAIGAISFTPSIALADSPTPEFLEAERLRAERQKRLAEGRKAFEKKVKAISRSATVEEFETATDNLSLLLISDGLPEGVQPKDVVTKVRVAYLDFDTPCP